MAVGDKVLRHHHLEELELADLERVVLPSVYITVQSPTQRTVHAVLGIPVRHDSQLLKLLLLHIDGLQSKLTCLLADTDWVERCVGFLLSARD